MSTSEQINGAEARVLRRAAEWSADAVAERPTSGTEFGRRVPDSGTEATT
ncbi:MAG: hypothetical protein ACRDSL_00510 [Pseudonocardiaceae bacterium]